MYSKHSRQKIYIKSRSIFLLLFGIPKMYFSSQQYSNNTQQDCRALYMYRVIRRAHSPTFFYSLKWWIYWNFDFRNFRIDSKTIILYSNFFLSVLLVSVSTGDTDFWFSNDIWLIEKKCIHRLMILTVENWMKDKSLWKGVIVRGESLCIVHGECIVILRYLLITSKSTYLRSLRESWVVLYVYTYILRVCACDV